jgi:anti-sigma28 factor (negative regulator of flagellin synthesis)
MKNRHPNILSSITSTEKGAQLAQLLGELYAESPDSSTIRFIQSVEDHFKNNVTSRARSQKSSDGSARSDVKERFAGKNRKWIKLPVEKAVAALRTGIDQGSVDDDHIAEDMIVHFEDKQFGWARYIGPRLSAEGTQVVQFEIRYRGGKVDTLPDNPRVNLAADYDFEFLPNTPQSMGWEG